MNPHGPRYHSLISHPVPSRREGRWRRVYRRIRQRYRDKIVENHIDLLRLWMARLGSRRVLEIGTGNGRVLRALSGRRGREISIQGIDLPDAHSVKDVRIPAQPMDARQLAYAKGSFDLVYSLHTAEHLADFESVLSEVARVLVPGGHLLLIVPFEPFRGSHAYMESLSLTGNPVQAWRLARRLHVRRVGPVGEYRFGREALRLREGQWVFERWLSPERLFLYQKASCYA